MTARGAYGAGGVGELVETVPDRDDVDVSVGLERFDRPIMNLEAERAGERIGLGVHVDAGELPAGVARRGEEGADVAADLDAAAAPAEDLGEPRGLRIVRGALRVVEVAEDGFVG